MYSEFEELQEGCGNLVGKKCWSVVAGSGTGSHVSFGFGGKIPRGKHLSNPNLTSAQRESNAEYKLFVECVWRLDDQNKVVCGAWDDNQSGGPMLTGLARLIDHGVTAAFLRRPGLDLELTFDHDLRLTVFCDQVNEQDEYDNYSLFLPQTIICIGSRSSISFETRD